MTNDESEIDEDALDDLDSDDDAPLSADQLSQAFAHLMEEEVDSEPTESTDPTTDDDAASEPSDEKEDTVVSPASVMEAMLFVGHPENQPLTNRLLASFMRGVSPDEIDQLVVELNEKYDSEQTAYKIYSHGAGYSLGLRKEFEPLRNLFYGRVREARLSQSAIDLLSVVAYQQPIDRKEINKLIGKPSGGILNQLVRRELLQVERTNEKPKRMLYRTTTRFLDLFKLDSVDDLPRVDEPC